MFRRVIACCALACPMLSAAAAVEPLACPAGTHAVTGEKKPHRKFADEWCADANGVKEGPAREFHENGRIAAQGSNLHGKHHGPAQVFADNGAKLADMEFDNGKLLRMHWTLEGVETFIAGLNAMQDRSGSGVKIRAIDERNVGLDFHFADASERTGGAKLDAFRAYVRKDFCKLFRKPDGQFDAIHVRVFNEVDAKPQMETLLPVSECPDVTAPAGKAH